MDKFILVSNDGNEKFNSMVAASLYRLFDTTTKYNLRLLQIVLEDKTINENEEEVFLLKDGTVVDGSFGIYERLTGVEFKSNSCVKLEDIFSKVNCVCRGNCKTLVNEIERIITKKHSYNTIRGTITIIDIKGDSTANYMRIVNKALQNILEEDKSRKAISVNAKDALDGYFVVTMRSIHMASNIKGKLMNRVKTDSDTESTKRIYQMPKLLYETAYRKICNMLGIRQINNYRDNIEFIAMKYETKITICLVTVSDTPYEAHRSLIEALIVAGALIKTNIEFLNPNKIEEKDSQERHKLTHAKAIIMPGGYGTDGLKGKLHIIKFARENKIPYLGICLGFQLAIIEYCKNILGIDDATSEEFDNKSESMIIQLLKTDENEAYGPRHGNKVTRVVRAGKVKGNLLFGKYLIERFRHSYGLPIGFTNLFDEDVIAVTRLTTNKQYCLGFEYLDHPFFVGLQSHPEFSTRYNNDKTVFTALLNHISNGQEHKEEI